MSLMRNVLLRAASSVWLRQRATRTRFVRRAVGRFMPGEELKDAVAAAQSLAERGMGTLFTHLGENISDQEEAARVTQHYLEVIDQIRAAKLPTEISVKLTHLGLDLDHNIAYANLKALIARERLQNVVWIDMESSAYVEPTLELYRRARAEFPNVGVCLQAYLYRTEADLAALLPLGPSIRLVKGAYREPPTVAFARKRDVDQNFFDLASKLLEAKAQRSPGRVAIATHDLALIRQVSDCALSKKLGRADFEFQMLYGIQRGEQSRLAAEGYRSRVLISYGEFWFPWFMRRLAERPANLMFVARNLF